MTCTGAGGTASASTTVSMNTPTSSLIPQQQIHVVSVDSQELIGENGAATNALDGKPTTLWVTEWAQRTAPLPHTLVLDLGGQYQVDGFRYLPRQDGSLNGTIAGYQFYVSPDGTTWSTAAAAGTLAANTSEKTVRFTAKTGRYVRLVAVSEINGQPWTSAAELNVFGTVGTLPSVTLSAAPASITSGQAATLTWSATNATACSATWTTATATTGSQALKPRARRRLFFLMIPRPPRSTPLPYTAPPPSPPKTAAMCVRPPCPRLTVSPGPVPPNPTPLAPWGPILA